ncbi:MAG TPA: iron-sulfur protein [Pseudonocardiaceae bacterium]
MTLARGRADGGLARSVRVAADAQDGIRLRHAPPHDEPGWVTCAELLAAGLAGWADRVADWLRREYGEAPDRVVAGYLLSWYLTVPAQAGALLFHTARRVPRIGPADLAVRFDPGHPRPAEIAVLGDDFACRADDPAADRPVAGPVADDMALAAVLRGRYAAHAARFGTALATTLGDRVRLRRHTLWAAATDALDGAFWRIGQFCGNERAGVANAALVLPAALAPFTSASTLRPTGSTDSADGWTRRRQSCCFHYVLRSGLGPCATCPRVCDRFMPSN